MKLPVVTSRIFVLKTSLLQQFLAKFSQLIKTWEVDLIKCAVLFNARKIGYQNELIFEAGLVFSDYSINLLELLPINQDYGFFNSLFGEPL